MNHDDDDGDDDDDNDKDEDELFVTRLVIFGKVEMSDMVRSTVGFWSRIWQALSLGVKFSQKI